MTGRNIRELRNVIGTPFVIGEGPDCWKLRICRRALGGMPQTTLVPSRIMLDRSRAMDPHALSSIKKLRIERR